MPAIKYKFHNKLIKTSRQYLFVMLSLSILIVSCSERSGKNPSEKLPVGPIPTSAYFPLKSNSSWEYEWENSRGDRWRASMKIIGSREEQGTKVFIMVDSTMMFSLMEASQSAYLWDKEGLKHLYRVSSSGDSTVFSPPRIVIPGTMESGKINKNDHRYTVYSATGNVRFSADVRQQQKILAREPVLVNGKKHDNCIGIETVWTDTYADGSSQTRRKVIWYSEGVGPVKIISGIPPASVKIEGDAVGQLTYGK